MSTKESFTQKIAVASDHGGYQLKNHVIDLLKKWGYGVVDLGVNSEDSVDYPDYAGKLSRGVLSGDFSAGVLVCGTGIGMSITANRFAGIRAALCHSAYMAKMARVHNDANVLCLGERETGFGEAQDILQTFFNGEFEGDRHQRRIDKIESVSSN